MWWRLRHRHNRPNECGVTECQIPECATRLGTCCEHCPAAFRNRADRLPLSPTTDNPRRSTR